MARIVLGVTGSVAAVRTLPLVTELLKAGHELKVVLTEAATHFVAPNSISRQFREVAVLRDHDEWPADRYLPGDQVLHIELRRWAELLVVAPLDAHTLARFALGLSDNLLCCVFRAWDFKKPIILAPAMNTLMWESPVTRRHLTQLLADYGKPPLPRKWSLGKAAEVFAAHAPSIVLIPPQSKQLACGDIGVGAMAEVAQIAEAVCAWGQESPVVGD